MPKKKKLIGEVLKDMGLLNAAQVREALKEQEQNGGHFGEVLVRLGHLSKQDICKGLAKQFGLTCTSISGLNITPDCIRMIPKELAERHGIIPLHIEMGGDLLTVAMSDPLNFFALDSLRTVLKCDIMVQLTTDDEIQQALARYYGVPLAAPAAAPKATPKAVPPTPGLQFVDEGKAEGFDEGADGEAPVIKLVHFLVQEAIRQRSSDIHLEPMAEFLRVRYRVDGVLREASAPPKSLQASVISRIKIMAKMDIAEKRLPLDGRIRVKSDGQDIDLRVSTIPASHGESVVLRILDKRSLALGLIDLGFMPDDQKRFDALVSRPNGMVLVTGPTGCGKTTTLYAVLHSLNKPDHKLITVEDPVEYQMSGINQVQVHPQIGLTFASGLRSMLRQAPDIIMVGEIRDRETAGIAVQAALTGHLVLSTLHTNDTVSAVTRLIDMGVKPYLIASALQGVVAQRLVRTICDKCRQPFEPTHTLIDALAVKPEKGKKVQFFKGSGCKACGQTGYRGRKAIFEVLALSDNFRSKLLGSLSSTALKSVAVKEGMRTMRQDGIHKVLEGVTTIDEVLRVTHQD